MEEYCTTLGELRELLNRAIEQYGADKEYRLVGCYQATGLMEKDYGIWPDEPDTINLYSDICTG